MKYIRNEAIRPLGDLGARAALLAGRLGDPIYRPDAIFHMDVNGWPGDWEGRAILAQTMISRATGIASAFLRENVAALQGEYNEKGYLKGILPEGEFDEQQLSGHGWLMRGLCEYYTDSGDEDALKQAMRIAENLFLPTRGHFADYPVLPEERASGGGAAGNIAKVVRGWHVSTDTLCAFIPMDGLSRLYEITKDPRLGDLLSEMFEKFMTIDLVSLRAQTHATLTATRAILRLYAVTGEARYLRSAEAIFDRYVREGMTATYANFNWFRRPEWTEPCAIVDSFIVGMRLFEYTGKTGYADLARTIYYNGICRAQRPNGGFGCDSCADENGQGSGDLLTVKIYEASWCCTMRGAEGLAMAARFGYLQDGDTLIVPILATSRAEFEISGGKVVLYQRADSEREGRVEFLVEENTTQRPVKLKIMKMEWEAGEDRFDESILPAAGETVTLEKQIPVWRKGRRLLWGNLMLGTQDDRKTIDPAQMKRRGQIFESDGAELAPIADSYRMGEAKLSESTIRVLFDESCRKL